MLRTHKLFVSGLIWLIIFPYPTLRTKLAYLSDIKNFHSGGSLFSFSIILSSLIVLPIISFKSFTAAFRLFRTNKLPEGSLYLLLATGNCYLFYLCVLSLPGLLYM